MTVTAQYSNPHKRDKIPTTILVEGYRTDEIVRPGHAFQGTDAFPEDALDERKLLDWLSQPVASPGSKGDATVALVKIGDCKLDLAGHTFVDGSGREVRLTRAETALLTAFVDSPRRVLSRDQLRYAVAGGGAEPYDRSVDMLVARLRRKIEPDPKAPRFILSVPGVGYKFDVRPQSAADGEAPPALELGRSARPDARGPPGRHAGPGQCRATFRGTKAAVDGAGVRARRLNSARSQSGAEGLWRHHPTFPRNLHLSHHALGWSCYQFCRGRSSCVVWVSQRPRR
jgi:DNA-binding winged helix-turn-helix (wHTH) protein